jgi:ABC-type glycerol-3-phosphate transport system permease component
MPSKQALPNILYYFAIILCVGPFLLPLLWMVSTAFMPVEHIYSSPPHWLPIPATLDNFIKSWSLLDFPLFFKNTLLITALAVIGSLFSSSLVGFAFAILPARGKNILFYLMLATIMVPPTVTLIPLFILYSKLGWTNTYLPLILPYFCANAFFVFLFRQLFRSLPFELFDSAEIDGCNPFLSYWYIALPLSRPALAAVAIFTFINSWNDFLGPLVYLNTQEKFTISLGYHS